MAGVAGEGRLCLGVVGSGRVDGDSRPQAWALTGHGLPGKVGPLPWEPGADHHHGDLKLMRVSSLFRVLAITRHLLKTTSLPSN